MSTPPPRCSFVFFDGGGGGGGGRANKKSCEDDDVQKWSKINEISRGQQYNAHLCNQCAIYRAMSLVVFAGSNLFTQHKPLHFFDAFSRLMSLVIGVLGSPW